MNTKNFGDSFYVSDHNERIDQFAPAPLANPEPVSGETPVLATLIEETPVGVNTAGVSLVDESFVHEEKIDEVMPAPAPNSETIPAFAAEVETKPLEAAASAKTEFPAPLLDPNESEHLRTRWNEIQGKFVDEPRDAVKQADALVAEVVDKITQMFASEHGTLESQWKQGNDVSTEDLRKALQHYRSFFNRLVV